jgi:hypothetical protein
LAKNVADLLEELIAGILSLLIFGHRVSAMFPDDQHAIDSQLVTTAPQRLGNRRIDREAEFFGALAAQVVLGLLIDISSDDIQRRSIPVAIHGIPDQKAFRHVPRMGVIPPFRGDDCQTLALRGQTICCRDMRSHD